MKKILLFSLLLFACSQLSAQQIGDYYDYGYSLYEKDSTYGTLWSFYDYPLFPDSTVRENDGNGNAIAVQTQSDGGAFDPTDTNFNFTNNALTAYMSYTVDSIIFGYNYKRYQLAVPDTLLIQIYTDTDIIFSGAAAFPNDAWYATVPYDYTIREGAGASFSIKVPLTLADESLTDTEEDFLSVPFNVSVAAGSKIAATITYFPGNPYTVGDTIDPTLSPHKHINCFQVFDYQSSRVAPTFYNNELYVDPSVRYNFDPLWDSVYIPGTASYGDTVYNLDMEWYITFDSASLSVKNIPLITNAAIYPNPSGVNSTANLVFSLVNDNDLTIDLTNDVGVKVLLYSKQHFQAGVNHFEINTTNLPAGVYICNIIGVQGNQTLKLAIQ